MNDKQNPYGIPTEEEARNKKRTDAELRILIETMEPFGFDPVAVFREFGAPAREQLRQDIGKHHFTGTAALIMTKLLDTIDSVEATLTALHKAAIKQSVRVAELECLAAVDRIKSEVEAPFPAPYVAFAAAIASVPTEVHESGWQWRPTQLDTAFAPPFGDIRVCLQCGCLVAGGPTACVRCATSAAREDRLTALESKVATLEAEVATKIAFPVPKRPAAASQERRPDPSPTPKVLKSRFKPYQVNCICGCEYLVESAAAHVFEPPIILANETYISTCPECGRKNRVPTVVCDPL